jgi:hypothetical protein
MQGGNQDLCVAKTLLREASNRWRRANTASDNMTALVVYPHVSRATPCQACFPDRTPTALRESQGDADGVGSQNTYTPTIPNTAQAIYMYVHHLIYTACTFSCPLCIVLHLCR